MRAFKLFSTYLLLISARQFTKYSQWVRFCLLLADHGRSSIYNFTNQQFVSKLPMYFPENYKDFNNLPSSYNRFSKQVKLLIVAAFHLHAVYV